MVNSIIRYIEFLKKEYGLSVSIHDSGNSFGSFAGALAPYNVHSNPYCLYVKSCRESWNQCILRQQRVAEQCKNGCFFGSCYSGVGEFVVPIKNSGNIIGFISVSGYKGSRAKMLCFAEKYGFSTELISSAYESCLSSAVPDIEFVRTVIEPLAAMLSLFYMQTPSTPDYSCSHDCIYGHIVSVLQTRYADKITIASLARMCHCSQSLISRIFKEKSGVSVNRYLNNIRIEKAKELLRSTGISLSEIAALCGFSDSNYFIYAFGKAAGVSPKKYRSMKQK